MGREIGKICTCNFGGKPLRKRSLGKTWRWDDNIKRELWETVRIEWRGNSIQRLSKDCKRSTKIWELMSLLHTSIKSQGCDSSGRFVFYKLTLHRFVRMVMEPLVWTQWEKAGQEEPHWNKRQTTRVIYSTPTNTNSFSKVQGLAQEVHGLFTQDTISIAQCTHGLWTVEFSNGRLGASHCCSASVVFVYSLPP